ncbi:hypothetical protein [Variovorax boronicumulans]|uniref:hypothetical protein n=1 Tax=Variovorax boronicumulans TaxID=436515 RepID=UPI00278618E2|nr:hypothetical protein [Variovorax boronicumulans]MDQ0042249.1 hypothetical protein [Variovorax boronicumulans]
MHSFETLSFYRGLSKDVPLDRPSLFKTRKDRIPRDTPIHLHNAANEWFKGKFGVAYRSEALFLTPSPTIAQFYGKSKSKDHCVRVIPIGPYTYCWSSKYADFLHLAKDSPSPEELAQRLDQSNYDDKNLDLAHESGNEIMLCCAAYITIPIELFLANNELAEKSSIIV